MSLNTDPLLRIGDLTFWGGLGQVGFFVEDDGFTGWEDAPPTRTENLDRITHGSLDSPEFYEARIVTVTGNCYARSAPELGNLRNQFIGTLQGLMRLDGLSLGTRSTAHGRRFGEPSFRANARKTAARYQFSVRCPDPRRYGQAREFPSAGNEQVTFWHRGNFTAAPKHIVSGTGPGYTINGPDGKRFIVREPVTPDRPHTIDMATGQVTIGGTVRYGIVARADTWAARPGMQELARLVPAGGSLSMLTRTEDTWV